MQGASLQLKLMKKTPKKVKQARWTHAVVFLKKWIPHLWLSTWLDFKNKIMYINLVPSWWSPNWTLFWDLSLVKNFFSINQVLRVWGTTCQVFSPLYCWQKRFDYHRFWWHMKQRGNRPIYHTSNAMLYGCRDILTNVVRCWGTVICIPWVLSNISSK